MKKLLSLVSVVLAFGMVSLAQIQAPTSDVLGAHLNYGRGCAACHAPHGGAYGNGAAKTPQTTAAPFLWGQDTSSLLGQTILWGNNVVELLPASVTATTPDVVGVLMCLSCHDGNYATGAMMRNRIYETLPPGYGTFNNIPTLVGNEGGLGVGDYLGNHPVGLNAIVTCGAPANWDCVETNGVISMTGANSAAFVLNYGYFSVPSAYNNTAVVMCTTCHNQHLMNVVQVITNPLVTGLPSGNYATMFFIRAPYNGANSTNVDSNQNAQFCRQCHGAFSNEMNGASGQPTVF
jgi:cytochrome c553